VRFGQQWTGKDGKLKSGSFEFLGFTHIAGKSRPDGQFLAEAMRTRRLGPGYGNGGSPSQGHIADCGLRINRMKSRPFLSGFVPLRLGEWQHAQLGLKL